jgi:pyruvate carboxylase
VDIERGKTLVIVLDAIGDRDETGHRTVYFHLNGQPRQVRVRDDAAVATVAVREKADPSDPGSVGAPMPGTVVDLRVAIGDTVEAGDPLCVLSAMKMETVVGSPAAGEVVEIAIAKDDTLAAGDLLVRLVR